MKYRADIDGLRAVAVVPVMLYHAGLPFFSGGFVGVDVFFVISGYLIAGLILEELASGSFSIARFYERRLRRILPALTCMIGACLVAGWFLLAPDDYGNLGQSAIAALLSFSNLLFFNQDGYFDTPTAEKPLLHTWSLGIEEQFYLVFPLYLILVAKFLPRWRLPLTMALCAISFGLCVAMTATHPTAAFFLPQTRVWELLLGALLAMAPRPSAQESRWTQAGAALGLGLIALSIASYSDATVFPGVAAMLPAVGAALVIRCGAASVSKVGLLLARPAAVFVGKISYSLYLWHFPLLAFGYYLGLGTLSSINAVALLVATFGIAFLSWRFVEMPARNVRTVPLSLLLRAGTASIWVLIAASVAVIAMRGVPDRVQPEAMQRLALMPDRNGDRDVCYAATDRAGELSSLCPIGTRSAPASDQRPSFVVWGDSHAEALRGAFDTVAKKFGQSGVYAGERGCPPLLDVHRRDWSDCVAVNRDILAMIKREPAIRSVILAARWGMWAERKPYKAESGPSFVLQRDGTKAPDATNHAAFRAGLEQTIQELRAAGKEIWLVGPIPEIGYNVPRSFFLQSLDLVRDLDIRPTMGEFRQRQNFAMQTLEQLAASYDAALIYPHEALCDSDRCRIQQDGHSLYFDDDHPSRFGAESLHGVLEPIFDGSRATDDGEAGY